MEPKNVKVAEQFSVRVKSNPTTGFSWDVQSHNSDVIKFIKSEFHPPGLIVFVVDIRAIQGRRTEREEYPHPPILHTH